LPQGTLLVTGPTGSGKSTTLYSALHLVRKSSLNIVTVEDRVEYVLPGIQPGPCQHARGTDVC
jgi:type IV pilus assembly protein PilB